MESRFFGQNTNFLPSSEHQTWPMVEYDDPATSNNPGVSGEEYDPITGLYPSEEQWESLTHYQQESHAEK